MDCLSAIIVSFNTVTLLAECLDHLFASHYNQAMAVYVVDNGSVDGSQRMVRDRFPAVQLIETGRNLGFAGANNLALRQILSQTPPDADRTRQAVLLLNSDCIVEPDTLCATSQFLMSQPSVGVVGPKLLLRDGRLDLACRRSFPTPSSAFWKLTGLSRRFPDSPRLARYNLTYLDPETTHEVDSVSGAYMMVRLAAIDDAGLLDDSFFMYGEDLDWAFRIKEHGWKVYYYPAAHALHYKGGSNAEQSHRVIFEFYRAMYLFHRKHYASATPSFVNALITSGIVLRGGLALARNTARHAVARPATRN